MLIPVRCITCGTILSSKYAKYKKLMKNVRQHTKESNILTYSKPNTQVYHDPMEQVGLKRYCCKARFLGQQETLLKLTSGF